VKEQPSAFEAETRVMKFSTIAIVGALCGIATANSLHAQPALDRVEQLLRDQVDAVRKPPLAPAPPQTRSPEPGYLGLIADDEQAAGRGVRIVDVVPTGPAAKAGLQTGDLITSMSGLPVRVMDDVARAMQGKTEGAKLAITVRRAGTQTQHEVILGRRPPAPLAEPAPRERAGPNAPAQNGPAGAQGPRLGVRTVKVTDEARRQNNMSDTGGAQVVSLTAGSPADLAGIRKGAVIVAFDGKPINSPDELAAAVREAPAGEVELTYLAAGQTIRKRLTLAVDPAPSDGPELEPHERPIAIPPKVRPVEGPALATPLDARAAAMEARIRELEQRIEKLEAALANQPR
jgi:membrane-associated protease RseP (regulator of RpoE activity)